jgi:hypothetical protein
VSILELKAGEPDFRELEPARRVAKAVGPSQASEVGWIACRRFEYRCRLATSERVCLASSSASLPVASGRLRNAAGRRWPMSESLCAAGAVGVPGTANASIWIVEPDSSHPFRKLIELSGEVPPRAITWTSDGSSLILGRQAALSDLVLFERQLRRSSRHSVASATRRHGRPAVSLWSYGSARWQATWKAS